MGPLSLAQAHSKTPGKRWGKVAREQCLRPEQRQTPDKDTVRQEGGPERKSGLSSMARVVTTGKNRNASHYTHDVWLNLASAL